MKKSKPKLPKHLDDRIALKNHLKAKLSRIRFFQDIDLFPHITIKK
jgi:hypothetical protein